jgi:hypothetical protein
MDIYDLPDGTCLWKNAGTWPNGAAPSGKYMLMQTSVKILI